MKHVLYAFLMLTLFACQKENKDGDLITVEPGPVYTVCKVATIQEYPAIDGKNILRTFTYDAANRVVKMDIQSGTAALVTKNISYNSDNKIEKITYNNGNYEVFTYANGAVSGWEIFTSGGTPLGKAVLTYQNGRLVREDRFQYNATTRTQELKEYLVYEWDGAGNIAAAKTYSSADGLRSTDNYTYHTDKVNKQQAITPQMELLFLNWSNDITAFMYSKNLLKGNTNKKRNLAYNINASGWVTAIKSEKQDNYFTFTYGCNN